MGIKISRCYSAYCDECEEPFGDGDSTYHFESEKELIRVMEESDWVIKADDGKILCDDCKCGRQYAPGPINHAPANQG